MLGTDRIAIVLIGDGMGGRPLGEPFGKTTIEKANTPNLDRLAGRGMCGLMDPIAPGVRAGSDTSHLAILGYDPFRYYRGRGPFECRGIGMDVRVGDVGFRCNFSTMDEQGIVIDRRAGRIEEGTDKLLDGLNGIEIEGIACYIEPSVAHRAGLVLRGEGLSHRVTDVDPHTEGVHYHESVPMDDSPEAAKTARVLNAFVQRAIEHLAQDRHGVNTARKEAGLPLANVLTPRGAGVAPDLPPFGVAANDEKARWAELGPGDRAHIKQGIGLSGAMVVETGLIWGIGYFIGMEVIKVEGATGGHDTDIEAIGRAVLAAREQHNFILCNVKCPDVGGHDRKPHEKIAAIEKVDVLAGMLLDELDFSRTVLVVSADHATPVSVGDHSGDPVPIMFCGLGVAADNVGQYGERACASGSVGRIHGRDIVNMATNLLDIQEKFGA
jgi:2,3-bisphosphoglycerate-independent phosphoglycerate mutase